MLILMKYPAESVTSSNVKACDLVRSCQRDGQWLERAGVGDALVRAVPVVEVLELWQGVQEVGSRPLTGSSRPWRPCSGPAPAENPIHAGWSRCTGRAQRCA